MKLVLAGSYLEFCYWKCRNMDDSADAVYLTYPEQLRDLKFVDPGKVVYVGNYWRHKRNRAIENALALRISAWQERQKFNEGRIDYYRREP